MKKRVMFHIKKRTGALLVLFLTIAGIMGMVSGCGDSNSEIVFTTGLTDEEVFKIDGSVCTLSEAMVFLTTVQNQYENTYGVDMWEQNFGGVTLEEYVKESVIAQLAQIKSMDLLAKSRDISLTEEEIELAVQTGEEYYKTLSEKEIEYLKVSKESIAAIYSEYALANKAYVDLTKDVNTEVSDDEARVITVLHILVKTYTLDESGNKVEFTEEEKAEALSRATQILEKARADEDFVSLAEIYNEDEQTEYTIARGQMESGFDEKAFSMSNDEISDIVETEYGYHIIKCVNSFNKEKTDENKLKIAEKRKTDVFNEIYYEFTAKLSSEFNDNLWDNIVLEKNEEITTSNFFEIYNEHYGS